MKTLVTLMAVTMVIALSSVNSQQPPSPYSPAECFANFTGVCRSTSTGADVARCCVFWSDLMKNENDHPCICSLFGISNFSYEDALGYLLDCQVNVTGFNFCPELRGSPKLSPPPPRGKIQPSPPASYNATRKPPPQPSGPSNLQSTPPSKTSASLIAGTAVGSVLFVLVLVVMFFMWRKLIQIVAEGQRKKTFTYEELEQATDGFSDKNFLGRGGFALVHKGLLRDGRVVAVKRLMNGGEEGEREFRTEIRNIGGLHPHKHVVSLIGHCITQEKRLLVYEFVPNGSLSSRIHGKGESIIDWSTRMKIAVGSARGIAYLHHDCYPNIIHRDIKSANILLDENFEAKIADFGLSKWKPEDETHVSTKVIGTVGYLAPEYEATGHVTLKADIYSFGAVIIELITGHMPNAVRRPSKSNLFIHWVIPFLVRSIQDNNYDTIADPRLNGNYNKNEMSRMAACAACCIQRNEKLRPAMSLVIPVLEGAADVNVLNLDMSISSILSESHNSIQEMPGRTDYTGTGDSSQASTNSEKSGTSESSKYFAGFEP